MEGSLLKGLGEDGTRCWYVAGDPVKSGAWLEIELADGQWLPVTLELSRDTARIRWPTRGGQAVSELKPEHRERFRSPAKEKGK